MATARGTASRLVLGLRERLSDHEEKEERPECQRALLHWAALPDFAFPPVVKVYAGAWCEQDQAEGLPRKLVCWTDMKQSAVRVTGRITNVAHGEHTTVVCSNGKHWAQLG